MCLRDHAFLQAVVGEDPDVVVVREDSVPPAADSHALDTLSVLELIVPLFDVFPLIEWLELDV